MDIARCSRRNPLSLLFRLKPFILMGKEKTETERAMYKILIVEDDYTIAETLKKSLEGWGFAAAYITDFRDVTGFFAQYKPHLVPGTT